MNIQIKQNKKIIENNHATWFLVSFAFNYQIEEKMIIIYKDTQYDYFRDYGNPHLTAASGD